MPAGHGHHRGPPGSGHPGRFERMPDTSAGLVVLNLPPIRRRLRSSVRLHSYHRGILEGD